MKRFFKSMLAFIVVFTWFLGSSAMAQHSKAFQGRKLFVTYCYLCHGMNGKGDGPLAGKLKVPAANLTDAARVGKRTDAELFGIIQGGKHDGLVTDEMPKWGKIIPGPQIEALVAYVRFVSTSKHSMMGEAELGEAVYMKYCTSCHGKEGKGDGIMISLVQIKPADHTNTERMEKITNEELVNTITNGKSSGFMPGWKGILTDAEIASVASYVRFLDH